MPAEMMSESRQRRNPATSSHCRRMPAEMIPAETGQNLAMVRSLPDMAKMARIWPKW
jgi:hypothetical protein